MLGVYLGEVRRHEVSPPASTLVVIGRLPQLDDLLEPGGAREAGGLAGVRHSLRGRTDTRLVELSVSAIFVLGERPELLLIL